MRRAQSADPLAGPIGGVSKDFLTQKAFTIVNADLGYHSAEGRWSVTAWIKNVSDRAVYNDARRYGVSSFSGGDIRPPRTFGVRLNYEFF